MKSPLIFTKNDIKFYNKLICNMLLLIPCSKCILHFKNYVKKLILENGQFKNRDEFIAFFINIHNEVNKNNNKPILDHQEALDLYHNKPINHFLLNNYLLYHFDRIILHKSSLKIFIKILQNLMTLYPCDICLNILDEYQKKYPLSINFYENNLDAFTKWFTRLFNEQDIKNHFVKSF
jgi:hypothetical protein